MSTGQASLHLQRRLQNRLIHSDRRVQCSCRALHSPPPPPPIQLKMPSSLSSGEQSFASEHKAVFSEVVSRAQPGKLGSLNCNQLVSIWS